MAITYTRFYNESAAIFYKQLNLHLNARHEKFFMAIFFIFLLSHFQMEYIFLMWTLLRSDVGALKILEGKILRKMFYPVHVGYDFHIRIEKVSVISSTIRTWCSALICSVISLRWLCHVVRMEDDVLVRRVFNRINGRYWRGWKLLHRSMFTSEKVMRGVEPLYWSRLKSDIRPLK